MTRRGLTVVAMVVLLATSTVGRAAADGDQLGLSWDGSTWTTSLAGSLFSSSDSPRLWVPGDSDSARFLVRNRSGEGAALLVSYRLDRPAHLGGPVLRVSARVGRGHWQPLADTRGWLRLDRAALATGAVAVVTVRAVFSRTSRDATQARSAPLRFRVTLSQTSAGGPTSPGGPSTRGGPAGLLPNTGTAVARWMIAAAMLCLGAGLALVARSRTREGRDE